MDLKKVKNSASMTGLVMSILLGIAIFTGMYLFWNYHANESGNPITGDYNTTYNNLTSSQTSLSNNINDIRNRITTIKTSDSIYLMAWNGFLGLGDILKLPINFIDTVVGLTNTLNFAVNGIVPSWAMVLAITGITAFIVFLILKNLKGEQGGL